MERNIPGLTVVMIGAGVITHSMLFKNSKTYYVIMQKYKTTLE